MDSTKTYRISEIQITPIKPKDGLIAIVSLVLDEAFYFGSIGIYTRRDGNGYRLTYPTKSLGERSINIYHPINQAVAKEIEDAVVAELERFWRPEC